MKNIIHTFIVGAGVVTASLLILTCAKTNLNCQPGAYSCQGAIALRCADDGSGTIVEQDCSKKNLVCTDRGCLVCTPEGRVCQAEKLLRCNDEGTGFDPEPLKVCDITKGEICNNSMCINACELAQQNRSYVGCEYWAVDLDNAVVESGSAAAQQFAVVLSNHSPLSAEVKVTVNDAEVGAPLQIREVTTRTVAPQVLEILLLPSREVDGSPPGEFDTGTGSALTNNAYKIESTVPLVVYQFNPLSNAGVFSNDASLLIPTPALSTDSSATKGAPYLVMGWPQTIATTDDPLTNFGSDLRAFLTIVGTQDDTYVQIILNTGIIGNGPDGEIPALKKGDQLNITLDAYQVLNLETGGFGPDADFTGTIVESDKPVVVFSGSEASDVPAPPDLTYRRCCADHLEEQLFPLTTLGRSFIALTTPSRSKVLKEAGATIQANVEKEYFRVLTAGEFTVVATSLDEPYDQLSITSRRFATIEAEKDFTIESNDPVVVGQFVASQESTGIQPSLPGGDPSFIILPPVEQFRQDYLFLTPDKYSFDFILVAAPKDSVVALDRRELMAGCDVSTGKKMCCTINDVGAVKVVGEQQPVNFVAYKCQLSFPEIIPDKTPPENLAAGNQNDGVHRLTSTKPAGLVVYGFDAYVSYGYPGGTDLALINVK
ncbi:MAG: IgGFc-binding protein [Pseudomonadota bacterium]